jgi:hypothetical protein
MYCKVFDLSYIMYNDPWIWNIFYSILFFFTTAVTTSTPTNCYRTIFTNRKQFMRCRNRLFFMHWISRPHSSVWCFCDLYSCLPLHFWVHPIKFTEFLTLLHLHLHLQINIGQKCVGPFQAPFSCWMAEWLIPDRLSPASLTCNLGNI